MPRPIHFEIPADQPERAIAFYQQVFGWRFQKWEGPMPYWLVQTGGEGPGIDGGLLARQHRGRGPSTRWTCRAATSSCAGWSRRGGGR